MKILSFLIYTLATSVACTQHCFPVRYPQFFGGTNDDTKFFSVDIDSTGNVVMGGSSKDTGIGTHYSPNDPIILFQDSLGSFKWGFLLGSTSLSLKKVAAVSFGSPVAEVWAYIEPSNYVDPIVLMKFAASSGAIQARAVFSSGKLQLTSMNRPFGFEQNHLQLVGTLNYGFAYLRLNITTFAGILGLKQAFVQTSLDGMGAVGIRQISSDQSLIVANIRTSATAFVQAIVTVMYQSFLGWSTQSRTTIMGIQQSGSGNLMKFTAMDYNDLAKTVWACGENSPGTDFAIYSSKLITVNNFFLQQYTVGSNKQGKITGLSLKCKAIYGQSDTIAFIVAVSGSSYNYLRADLTTMKYQKLIINADAFSIDSSNALNYAVFKNDQFYLVGHLASYQIAGLAQSPSPKLVGFIIANPLESSSTTNCIGFDYSLLSGSLGMVSSSPTFNNYSTAATASSVSLTADTTLAARPIISFTILSQPFDSPAICPAITYTFSLTPGLLTDQIKEIGSTVNSYTIPAFTVTSPTCTGLEFSYSATMADGSPLLSIFGFSAASRVLSYNALTVANIGVYNLIITGTVQNGQFITAPLQITIRNCLYSPISPVSVVAAQSYNFGGPLTIPIPSFNTAADPSMCGDLTYQITNSAGSPLNSAIYTVDTTYPTAMTLTVSTADTTLALQAPQVVMVKAFLTNFPSAASSYTFTVTFNGPCASANIVLPPAGTFNYVVGQGPSIHPIDFFTVDKSECQASLSYECLLDCVTQPSIFQLQSIAPPYPQITITANSNTQAGTYSIKIRTQMQSYPITQEQTFTVVIQRDCSIETITSSAIADQTYSIRSGTISTLANLRWTAQTAFCTSQLTYQVWDTDINDVADASVFSIVANQLLIMTQDTSKLGVKNLEVRGIIGTKVEKRAFQVQIYDPCITAIPAPEASSPDILYDIGTSKVSKRFQPWPDGMNLVCGQIKYKVTVDNKDVTTIKWASFDQSVLAFGVQSSNYNDLGFHVVKLTGKYDFSPLYSQVVFTVTINDPCAQNVLIPPILKDIELQPGIRSTSFSFQPFQTTNIAICGPFDYTYFTKESPTFTSPYLVSFNDTKRQCQVKVSGKALEKEAFLIMAIIGSLKNGLTAQAEFKIVFKVKPPVDLASAFGSLLLNAPVSSLKNMTTDLVPRVASLNTKGIMVISFSKPILEVGNLTLFEERTPLTLQLISAQASLKVFPTIESWKTVAFTKTSLTLQLQFTNSISISRTSVYDTIKVTFAEPDFFISTDVKSTIKKGKIISGRIPPQQQEGGIDSMVGAAVESMKNSITAALGANFILSLLLGVSMSNMWQIMNILQVITILPVLRVPLPPSFISLCQTLLKLSQLDILPEQLSMSYIRKLIMGQRTSSSFTQNYQEVRLLQSTETTATEELGPNLALIGLDNFDISEDIGSLADILCWFVIISVFIQILRPCMSRVPLARKTYDFFARLLFFNTFISACIQAYLSFYILALMAMKNYNKGSLTDLGLSVVIVLLVQSFPIIAILILCRFNVNLDQPDTKNRFGALYENIKVLPSDDGMVRFLRSGNILIFIGRRALLALTLILWSTEPTYQVLTMILLSMALLVYQVLLKPFADKRFAAFEFFNELSLLCIGYLMLGFIMTEDIENDKTHAVDNGLIYTVMSTLGLNFFNFLANAGMEIFQLLSRAFRRCKAYLFPPSEAVVAVKPLSIQHNREFRNLREPNDFTSKMYPSFDQTSIDQRDYSITYNTQTNITVLDQNRDIEQNDSSPGNSTHYFGGTSQHSTWLDVQRPRGDSIQKLIIRTIPIDETESRPEAPKKKKKKKGKPVTQARQIDTEFKGVNA